MTEKILIANDTMHRAQMRLDQAEAIISTVASTYEWIATVFKDTLAAKDKAALTTREA